LGQEFYEWVNSTTLNAVAVTIRHSTRIISFQMLLSDGVNSQYTTTVGGSSGQLKTWNVPQG